jgi:hypothetical protein
MAESPLPVTEPRSEGENTEVLRFYDRVNPRPAVEGEPVFYFREFESRVGEAPDATAII